MAASQFTPALFAPARKLYQRTTGPIVRLGHMLVFFGRALAGIPVAFTHYRKEFVRLLSDIAWGNGSLVVGGGTAGVASPQASPGAAIAGECSLVYGASSI